MKLLTRLVLLIVSAGVSAAASAASPFEVLLETHPAGFHWEVTLLDASGKPMGTLDLKVTAASAQSCLGSIGKGLRVEILESRDPPAIVHPGKIGIAAFQGDDLQLDLGSPCDAYMLLEGKVFPDGHSSGELVFFGMGGGRRAATYRAVVK